MANNKIACLVLFMLFILHSFAQNNNGVHIIHDLSWTEIKAKAKSEHKNILIDCNSSWCGPCKYLEHVLFPKDTIGKLLNPKFLVVSVQFDSTDNDNNYIKSWYPVAKEFKNKYHITGFPTELILDENANPITKFVGIDTENGVENLYDRINNSFQSKYQYFILKNKEKSDEVNTSSALKVIAEGSMFAGEMDDFKFYYGRYLSSLTEKEFNTANNYEFIVKNTHSSKDSLFDFMLQKYKMIDSVVGSPIAAQQISGIVYTEELKWKKIFTTPGSYSEIHGVFISEPNWTELADSIDSKYEKLIPEIIYMAKMDFYSLGRFDDKYFELILSKYNPNKNISQTFPIYQIFKILDSILTKRSTNLFWLIIGLQWLDNIQDDDMKSKIDLYKASFQSRLSQITN